MDNDNNDLHIAKEIYDKEPKRSDVVMKYDYDIDDKDANLDFYEIKNNYCMANDDYYIFTNIGWIKKFSL